MESRNYTKTWILIPNSIGKIFNNTFVEDVFLVCLAYLDSSAVKLCLSLLPNKLLNREINPICFLNSSHFPWRRLVLFYPFVRSFHFYIIPQCRGAFISGSAGHNKFWRILRWAIYVKYSSRRRTNCRPLAHRACLNVREQECYSSL